MAYLIIDDFYKVYTETAFTKLIADSAGDPIDWTTEVATAVDEVEGYLRARYDVAKIFKDMSEHDSTLEYDHANRVYVDSAGTKTVYYALQDVPADTEITDTDYWRQGFSKVTQITIDVALYHLLGRLNNHDIPALRKERYDGNSDKGPTGGALKWLSMVAKGYVEPNLPLRTAGQTDQTGNRIIYDDPTVIDDYTAF